MTTIDVVIADDHPVYLDGLARAIAARPELSLVARAADGESALELIRSKQPQVAVIDLGLPGMDGLDVLDAIDRAKLPTRTLIVSALDDSTIIYQALEAGAAGYISKVTRGIDIGDSILAVARGEVVIPAHLQVGLLREIRGRRHGRQSLLTGRELDVIRLAADGRPNPAIAHELGVSVGTVKTHLQSAFAKLEATDRAAAVAQAMRRGLLR